MGLVTALPRFDPKRKVQIQYLRERPELGNCNKPWQTTHAPKEGSPRMLNRSDGSDYGRAYTRGYVDAQLGRPYWDGYGQPYRGTVVGPSNIFIRPSQIGYREGWHDGTGVLYGV